MKTCRIERTLTLFLTLLLSAGASCLRAQIFSSVPISGSLEFTSSNLPIVVINTHGQEIVDEYRIVADMGIIDNGTGQRNYLTDSYNDYSGKIAIELRGSATLYYPKKQYRFETQDATGNNLNVSLMGLPPENDWILYGPYDDQSLIRNVLAYKLSNDLGRYASRTRLCELVLNGGFRGLYVLIEKIKRDPNRVNIAQLDPADNSGNQLTGGYIIKIDKISGENVEEWQSDKGTKYQYHYPKADVITWEQKNYIQNFMNEFEMVMDGPDYNDPSRGYQKYIDLASFVDHFIINEACKNVDAYRISAFLYKDRDSRNNRLMAGPVWDFNLSFGKAWFEEDLFQTTGWQVDYNSYRPWDYFQVPFWWEKLSRDYEFVKQLKNRWNELRQGILQMDYFNQAIDSLVTLLSEAIPRNFERWPESALDHTYTEEINQLKEWLNLRIVWLDANLDVLHQETDPRPNKFYLRQNYPNPFTSSTVIEFWLRFRSDVKIEVFNMNGQKIREVLNSNLPAGYWSVEFIPGDLPAGIYFYKLQTNNFEAIRKMTFVK